MQGRVHCCTSGRVVFVGDMQVQSAVWSEQPLRIMHAAVALMAQLGLISGASIVVIDKRGYGWGAVRAHWPFFFSCLLMHFSDLGHARSRPQNGPLRHDVVR